MTQCEKLLAYLEQYGSISGLECIMALGIMNYKGRICDLRQDGYDIETVFETLTNARGEKKTFARYIYHERSS